MYCSLYDAVQPRYLGSRKLRLSKCLVPLDLIVTKETSQHHGVMLPFGFKKILYLRYDKVMALHWRTKRLVTIFFPSVGDLDHVPKTPQ